MNFHSKASPTLGTRVNLKKLAISVGVALTLGVAAVSAQAGTTVLDGNGDFVSYTAGDYHLGTLTAANSTTFADLPWVGSFSDTYTFTLGQGSGTNVGITSFFTGDTAGQAPGIGLTMTLTSNGSIVNDVPTAAKYVDLPNSNVAYGHTFSGLVTGHTYSLVVHGTDASLLGSQYTFQIAAVPEPESYAMLLAGLGLIGSIVRRRKSTVMGS